MAKKSIDSTKRHRARELALQLVYQWQISDVSPEDCFLEMPEDDDIETKDVDTRYLRSIIRGVPKKMKTLDTGLTPLLDRPTDQLDPITLAIMRIAAFELTATDTPREVIINEAIELAKKFGPEDSYKFVNGIVDKFSQRLKASNTSE